VQLIVECYRITKQIPPDERFGLTQQLRRAAVSVAANIAEGKGRGATLDFCRFLAIANGSLTELDTHLVIAHELGYLKSSPDQTIHARIDEVGRMLTALRKSLLRRKSTER